MGARGPAKNSLEMPITAERKQVFLDALRETGVWAHACRVASPHSPSDTANPPCSSSFRALVRRDIEFAAAVEEAMEEARAAVLLEIQRRGQEGWEEPIFQKGQRAVDHDGTPASVRKFSDNLLLARAKSMMPELFSEKHEHRHVVHRATGAHTFVSEDIHLLDPDQRAALTDILLTIQRRRGEADEAPALAHQPTETIDADFEEVPEVEYAEFDLGRED